MNKMRILHRYLGYFLAGIMSMYALSGIILIFRDTDFLKSETRVDKTVAPNLGVEELGKALEIRKFRVNKEEGNLIYFENGQYDKSTGKAFYTLKELPVVIEKMTHLHKAKSGDPLFFLNIFFGLSLLFFVVSSFWMYLPASSIFKKGMLYVLGGAILTLVLIWLS